MNAIRYLIELAEGRPRLRGRGGDGRRHVEAELLEGRFGDWKEDAHAAAGDGTIFPTLPEATPEGLYGEFEHDSDPPPADGP